jgi:hypothetical protein
VDLSLLNGKSFSLYVHSNSLTKNIKIQIEQKIHIPMSHQILYFNENLLEDNKSFNYYSISNDSEINLHIKLPGGSDSLIPTSFLFDLYSYLRIKK